MRKRPEISIAIAVGAIVVLAIVAVLASPRAADYPSGSPERALQSYLDAVIKGDMVTAFTFISEESDCTFQNLENSYVGEIKGVTLENSRVTGDEAKVSVRIEYGDGPLFGGSYGEQHSFALVKESGDWKIDGGAWPMYECGKWVR
jgi:hypothetical protein